jgi:hypothetical protein
MLSLLVVPVLAGDHSQSSAAAACSARGVSKISINNTVRNYLLWKVAVCCCLFRARLSDGGDVGYIVLKVPVPLPAVSYSRSTRSLLEVAKNVFSIVIYGADVVCYLSI